MRFHRSFAFYSLFLFTIGCGSVTPAGGDDGPPSVTDDGSGSVQDDGIESVQDDGIESIQDDGVGSIQDDGIESVGDDGQPSTGCVSDGDCESAFSTLAPCKVASCNTETGECETIPSDNGAACDDGNACIENSTCSDGVCTGGTEITCSGAANLAQCKLGETCDPDQGCVAHYDLPCQAVNELGLLPVASGSNFQQFVVNADTDEYTDAYWKWKGLNYYLINVSKVGISGNTKFAGIWRKRTDDIVDTKGWTALSLESYLEKFQVLYLASDGWRVLDLDGLGTPSTYSMAMVQESEAADLTGALWRFSATNFEKIVNKNSAYMAEKNLTNKYPIGIGPWKNSAGDVGYITVWEENVDNLDWQIVHIDSDLWNYGDNEGVFWDYWNQGRRVRSFAKYCKPIVTSEPISCENKFLAVWINDKNSFFGEASLRMTGAAAFKEKLLELKEKNYELVDVDQYILDGSEKFAGQWVRRFRRDYLRTNLPSSGNNFTDLQTLLGNYDGNIGFYIEDLSTGNHISYNRHEHFYMASMTKVWIATKILSLVDAGTLSLDDEFVFFNEDYLEEDNTPGILDISKIGQSFTLEEYIGWMINYSSTNATDKIFGLIGNEAMNDYLVNDLGIRSIGEITSICDLDKRFVSLEVPCAETLPCNVFERWYREDESVGSNILEQMCLTNLAQWDSLGSSAKNEHHRRYYATLANSISPAQMAQFYRRLLSFELLQPETRNKLIEIMDATGSGTNNDSITGLGLYNKLACKGGNKWRSQSWTAVTWFEGDTESLSDATFNYNINVFIEQFPGGLPADYDKAKNLSRDVIGLAVGFLSENN